MIFRPSQPNHSQKMPAFRIFLPLVSSIFILSSALFSQVGTFTVASVSMRIDTLNSTEKAAAVIAIFQKYPEVRDLDLKAASCNFTFDNQTKKLDLLMNDFKTAGFILSKIVIRENQTFSTVPVDDHSPKKEITEKEAQELKEKGMLPKE